jgi:hypothetical protein
MKISEIITESSGEQVNELTGHNGGRIPARKNSRPSKTVTTTKTPDDKRSELQHTKDAGKKNWSQMKEQESLSEDDTHIKVSKTNDGRDIFWVEMIHKNPDRSNTGGLGRPDNGTEGRSIGYVTRDLTNNGHGRWREMTSDIGRVPYEWGEQSHSPDLSAEQVLQRIVSRMSRGGTTVRPIDGYPGRNVDEGKTGPGLWANIHKKRASGEKMRKKGDPGAPTEKALKAAQAGSKNESVAESSEASDDLVSTLNSFDYYSDNGNVYVNDAGEKIARQGSNWKHQSGKTGRGAEELGKFLSSKEGVAEGNKENKAKKNEYVSSIIQKKLHPSVLPSLKYGRRELQKDKDMLEETYHDDDEFFEAYGVMEYNDEMINEAEYQGRKVTLNKPMQGDVKKFKVYTKNEKGNVVKVNFGDKNSKIKKNNPARRKSFRARHNCDNPGPKTSARYWSCRKW